MEKTLIVANWKQNFIVDEAQEWVVAFSNNLTIEQFSNSDIVICPSFVVLPTMARELSKLENIKLGAQDVSKFEEGQYTGEVSAKMLKDFVDYVIVGHSERRKYFGETDGDVNRKIEQCLKHNLMPVVCVSTTQELSSLSSELSSDHDLLVAYEPLFAVGTGTPDTPKNANDFALKVKTEVGRDVRVLYGGSVSAENVRSFVSQSDISGVLVGQASLEAEEFARIIADC